MSATSSPLRLVVVDDHPVVRDGLVGMLAGEPGLQVVGQADGGVAGVEVVAATDPDVLLIDLRMPAGDGWDAIATLRAADPARPRILVLTTYDSPRDIHRAMAAGADGYLLKDAPRAQLVQAICDLAAGGEAMSPRVRDALAEAAAIGLTERERRVLGLVADGLTNRAIGSRLGISEATVKTHLANLFPKLGAPDRAAAVRIAWERGLV